jgi:hypothetical protein
MLAGSGLFNVPQFRAQSIGATPKWEVASIRLCDKGGGDDDRYSCFAGRG